MIVSSVVAASDNNVIGKNNKLLWHLPNDLRFFKNTTWGMPVVMGRKTFDSVKKPLTGRTNIIITRDRSWQAEGVIVVPSLEEALSESAKTDALETFIVGGGEIYRQSMPMVHRLYITRVHAEFDGDTFFPEIDMQEWNLVSNKHFDTDERHAYPYSFQLFVRKTLADGTLPLQ
jgi:dihydrofolate reductase